ncbi:MAG: hypothetical protein Q9214_005575, partial [Letrouitia sp. 1 TL-2023]
MVANGARHLALTSRNPKSINKIWLDEVMSMGGNPQIFETDVVNTTALEQTYRDIKSKMPPIAGVANAAMVLSDSLFDDIAYNDFSKVLRPKVEGTANLDKVFNSPDLDFFILFSSFASTVGNRGQTNYLAANMYMATIAAQRRKRGLAASVMHIGMVLGLGVVFQTGLYESTMKKLNYMPISEPAFLDMFAQSIVVGRPDSGFSNEFITGLGRLSMRADAPKPFYASNVRFSHHVLHDDKGASSEATSASISLVQQLTAAKSIDEQADVIQEVFIRKLERVLQSSRDQIHPSQGLIALGIDSLMAVEVRSWFLSELEVDMPVLKLLGGACISEICAEAAKLRPHIEVTSENTPAVPVVQDVASRLSAGSQLPSAGKPSPEQFPEQPSRGSSGSPVPSVMLTPALSDQTPLTTPSVSSDGEQDFKWEPVTKKPKTYPTAIAGSTLDLERMGRMSFPQERLWFLRSYLSDPTTYNITLAYKLTGPLRVEAMEKAFDATIQRHEILRTAFYTDLSTGEAQQGVIAESPFKLERLEITDDKQVEDEFRRTNCHVYDLEHGDSMRAKLLRRDADTHFLIMGYHHIALDATTSLLLVRDFAMIYAGMKLEPLKLQYLDYAVKQRRLIKESGYKDIAYWKTEFSDSPTVLPFFDFGSVKLRKPLTEYKIRILETRLDASTTSKLKIASQKMQVTSFHLHLATLQVLLHRLLKIDDVCIGITDANKSDPDHFDTLGFFVNLLPIRSKIDGKQSFTGIAQKAKDKTFQALAHSQLPFDVLLDELNIPRTTDHTPLFQVLMNYKMGSNRTVPLGECKAEAIKLEDASNPYDLQFDVEVAIDGTTLITANTQAHLYSDADLST